MEELSSLTALSCLELSKKVVLTIFNEIVAFEFRAVLSFALRFVSVYTEDLLKSKQYGSLKLLREV
jgi:hypothetical protein